MKVIIFGGAGFIGRHLAVSLKKLGYDVLACDNFIRGSSTTIPEVTLIKGDIRNVNDVANVLQGADVVVNLAAISSVRKAEEIANDTLEINATSLWNLMAAAQQAGVRQFLQASSREVYGNPCQLPVAENHPRGGINIYGKSKEKAEQILAEAEAQFSIPVTLLRLANVIGSGDVNDGRVIPRWLSLARQGKPLTVIGGTDKSLDFVPVECVVDAFTRAIELPKPLTTNEPINIGSGQSITLAEVAERIRLLYPNTTIVFEESKVKEVAQFAADTHRMETILGISPVNDPLRGMEKFTFFEPVLH